MSKDQRKILGYLFGLVVAAVVAGWAVHLGLSYRSDSATATDGGVVIWNNQDTQAIHTGSGDIHQDNQTEGQGSLSEISGVMPLSASVLKTTKPAPNGKFRGTCCLDSSSSYPERHRLGPISVLSEQQE